MTATAKHVCPICTKEYENGRQLHGHLMRLHQDEYRAVDFKLADLKQSNHKPAKKVVQKPKGFRLLNVTDQDEIFAYKEGYRFIDADDEVYTIEEAKGEGWI
jgi:hypothetical protein